MKFYVGNLNFRITEDELREHFEPYGPIEDLIILHDRETGRSRGFGFITLGDDEKAKQAYAELNQKDFAGRTLVMNEARPRSERPQGGGGQRQSGGSGGGYGGSASGGYGGNSGSYSGGHSGGGGYTPRPDGGGYSNQTYGNTASNPSAATETDGGYSGSTPEGDPGSSSGDSAEPQNDGEGTSGGYSRGDAH